MMIDCMLWPFVRFVLPRIVSLNFDKLFRRGNRRCLMKRSRVNSKPSSFTWTIFVLVGCSLQKLLHQFDHRVIGNVLPQFRHQAIPQDGVEVGFQSHIDRVFEASSEQSVHTSQCVFVSPIGAKAEAVFGTVCILHVFDMPPFQNWFQHMAKGVLHDAISDRRSLIKLNKGQRSSLVRTRLRNVDALDRLRDVNPVPQLLLELVDVPLQTGCEFFDRDVVHARCPLVRGDLAVCRLKVVRFVDLVHQAMPLASSINLPVSLCSADWLANLKLEFVFS